MKKYFHALILAMLLASFASAQTGPEQGSLLCGGGQYCKMSASDPILSNWGMRSAAGPMPIRDLSGSRAAGRGGSGWEKAFGGGGFEHCYAEAMTQDGGYALAGWTDSFGNREPDMCLLKLNSAFEMEWKAVFGGSLDDFCESVNVTSDGGFILGGYTQSMGAGDYDMYLVKTDAHGQMEWQRTFGGKDYDVCWWVEETRDGGYILGGDTRSCGSDCDMYLVKTDSRGNLEWQRIIDNAGNDYCQAVHQTDDGGYILGGDAEVSPSPYNSDMCLIKTDPRGRVEWKKRFGGPGNDGCFALQQTVDAGFILAGDCHTSEGGSFDAYLVKTDSQGRLEWQRTYGGQGWDDARAVVQTSDQGFLVAGYSDSFADGDFDAYLVKTDAKGNTCSMISLGGPGNQYAYAVLEPAAGEWLLAGYRETNSGGDDIWLSEVGLSAGDSPVVDEVMKISATSLIRPR